MEHERLIALEFWEDGRQIVRVMSGATQARRFCEVLESAGLRHEPTPRQVVAHKPDRWEPLPPKMYALWEMM